MLRAACHTLFYCLAPQWRCDGVCGLHATSRWCHRLPSTLRTSAAAAQTRQAATAAISSFVGVIGESRGSGMGFLPPDHSLLGAKVVSGVRTLFDFRQSDCRNLKKAG